tara:strand:- start:860 stop:1012 length:153 start_codon:yes stop_codon:yes gene_type:complete
MTSRNLGKATTPRIDKIPQTIINSIKENPSFDLINFLNEYNLKIFLATLT